MNQVECDRCGQTVPSLREIPINQLVIKLCKECSMDYWLHIFQFVDDMKERQRKRSALDQLAKLSQEMDLEY